MLRPAGISRVGRHDWTPKSNGLFGVFIVVLDHYVTYFSGLGSNHFWALGEFRRHGGVWGRLRPDGAGLLRCLPLGTCWCEASVSSG